MATDAWVDWSQLPVDISRKIVNDVLLPDPDTGAFYRHQYLQRVDGPDRRFYRAWESGLDGRAHFHPNAFDSVKDARHAILTDYAGALTYYTEQNLDARWQEVNDYAADRRRGQIGKYAGLAAAAVAYGVVGSYATKWQSDKATTNEQPGTRKSQSVQSAAHADNATVPAKVEL